MSNRKNIYALCLFLTGFLLPAVSIASDPEALLESAGQAYSKGNFQKASEYYERILAMGYAAPELYFNLGNAYYKLDKIGMSILNYERAKKLAPLDEDISYNLKLANQRTLDKIEPMPRLFLEEWWDTLKSGQSERTWGLRSLACFILFLFFLGVFITSKRAINKQFGFWLGIVFLVLTLITVRVTQSRHRDIVSHSSAIILSSSAEIKNAPSETGTKLFILHEGAKVATPDSNGAWVKVALSSEKVGWVKRSQLAFI